jgi:hypothetical protein
LVWAQADPANRVAANVAAARNLVMETSRSRYFSSPLDYRYFI